MDDARLGFGMEMGTIEAGRPRLVYEDLLDTPDDGRRYEILDGRLYVTPSPNLLHQRASKRLLRKLEDFFETRGLAEVFQAPLDVVLAKHDVVEPDLLVVERTSQMAERGIEGPPLLAVEILSPSTRKRDRGVKAERYALLGVRHYWILDPRRRTLECRRTAGDRYELLLDVGPDDSLRHPDWPELVIDMPDIWADSPIRERR